MRTLTTEQYRAAIDTHRTLVQRGFHPAVAGAMVRRAVKRASSCCSDCAEGSLCNGMGVHQTRSLRRDLDPSIRPRPVVSGEQCVRIQEIPGDETQLYSKLEDYRQRGWTVSEVRKTQGYPSVSVYWACPPGRMPLEAQDQMLAARGWGMGATTIPTAPVRIADAPQGILANVAAAGDDPNVAAARNIVSKWSWLIPVGGLIMSAKQKVKSMISGGNDPSYSIVRSGRRR